MHFWPKFGNTDFNWWWLFARTSSKWGKFLLLSSIWPWSSRSIVPQNNRDLNQGLSHLWSKFGDSSLNGWWVIARTSWWLTDRHTHTHAGNDNTRRPKLASGKKQTNSPPCLGKLRIFIENIFRKSSPLRFRRVNSFASWYWQDDIAFGSNRLSKAFSLRRFSNFLLFTRFVIFLFGGNELILQATIH